LLSLLFTLLLCAAASCYVAETASGNSCMKATHQKMSARSSYNFSEREKEKGDSLAEINCRLIHELFAMQLADLFAPSTWRPFVTAECCLILCVSKMDVRLNFETDVRDKFQGGIWRVCLKSNVRVRYFFALSR
jgi:hypothetical protein